MALNASKIKRVAKKSNTPILEAGNYPARVVQVIDLGVQKRKAWQGVEKSDVNMLWVTYELPTEFMLDEDGKEDKEKPRWISEQMNLFDLKQENATSTKRILALDPKNALNGDWSQVLGLPCTVTVVHSKDGKYANIGAISPPMKGLEVGPLVNSELMFDTGSPEQAVFDGLPDFLQEKIKASTEWSAIKVRMEDGPQASADEEESDDEAAPY